MSQSGEIHFWLDRAKFFAIGRSLQRNFKPSELGEQGSHSRSCNSVPYRLACASSIAVSERRGRKVNI